MLNLGSWGRFYQPRAQVKNIHVVDGLFAVDPCCGEVLSSSASAPSCDAFVGVVREVCGDWDRDALLHDDVTFSQSSRTTWAAGMLALAVVTADLLTR